MNGDQIRPEPPGGAAPSRRTLAAALTAVAFLTRLPLPGRLAGPGALEASILWFPAVGVLVGGLAAAALLVADLLWPTPLPALVAVAVAVVVTGGFHEDGLADSADAFAAGGDLERRLRVLDDPRIGAVGAVVLVLVLLGRVASLALLPLGLVAATLVVAHCLARWTVPVLLWWLPYVRGETGIAARLKQGATGQRLVAATLLATIVLATVGAVLLLATPSAGGENAVRGWTPAEATVGLLAAALATVGVTLAAGALFRRRFGGVTGDLLGATCQVVELVVYLTVLALVPAAG